MRTGCCRPKSSPRCPTTLFSLFALTASPALAGPFGLHERPQVDLRTSRGTAAVSAGLQVYSTQNSSLAVTAEAGVLPTLRDWTTMAAAGATFTVGGSGPGHLAVTAAVGTERVGSWGCAPVRTVDTRFAMTGHLDTRDGIAWELTAELDPLQTLASDSLDGAVGLRRVHSPWDGTWHDVRFAVGLELRDSAPAQDWLNARNADARTLPGVMPYPTFEVWWQL